MANITKTEHPTETKMILSLEIPREDVGKKIDELFGKLQHDTALPGFRKGKAPLELVKLRFTKGVQEQAVQDVVTEAIEGTVKEQEIRFVGAPKLENLVKEPGEDGNQPITFQLEVEYIPKYDIVEYDKITIADVPFEVTETQVVDALESLRTRYARYEDIEDRGAEDGDYVLVSTEASIDEEPFKDATRDQYLVVLGEGGHLPGVEEALKGSRPGQKLEFDSPIPEDYYLETSRGKTCHFIITVASVRKQTLPDLDDEFAKMGGGFENISELKDFIREQLQANADQRKHEQNKEIIIRKVLAAHPFAVPESMVQSRFEYLNGLQEAQLKRMGATDDSMDEQREKLLETNRQQAEQQTRLSIILADVSEKEDITVSDDEFDTMLEQMARRQNYDPEQFAHYLFKRGLDDYYKRLFLEDKVLEFLLDKATFVVPGQVPADPQPEAETQPATEIQPSDNASEASE